MSYTSTPQKILITGANGLIGNLVFANLAAEAEAYQVFGLDRSETPTSHPNRSSFYQIPPAQFHLANISDFAAVHSAVQGMDTIVHLAANPNPFAEWQAILGNNIVGTYNIFESARLAGVKRVIFASTNQVVFGYRLDEPYKTLFDAGWDDSLPENIPQIETTAPVRPLNLYASSKVLGEALAHTYAYSYGLSCICLRIGWVTPDDRLPVPFARALWCSQRDIVQLIKRTINAPANLRFDIFYGQSDNPHNFISLQHTRDVLGYTPQDSARL